MRTVLNSLDKEKVSHLKINIIKVTCTQQDKKNILLNKFSNEVPLKPDIWLDVNLGLLGYMGSKHV